MILYDPHIPVSLTEFGIQIPVRDSRAVNTLAALREDPRLTAGQSRWHRDRIDESLDREDLERVHSRAPSPSSAALALSGVASCVTGYPTQSRLDLTSRVSQPDTRPSTVDRTRAAPYDV